MGIEKESFHANQEAIAAAMRGDHVGLVLKKEVTANSRKWTLEVNSSNRLFLRIKQIVYNLFHRSSKIEFVCDANTQPILQPILKSIKRTRITDKMRAITSGLLELKEQRQHGRILDTAYWVESSNKQHLSGPSLGPRFNAWKDSNTPLDFDSWLESAEGRRHPAVLATESMEREIGAFKVSYLSAQERPHYEITFASDNAGGVSLQRRGECYDTANESTEFSGAGKAIFVLSPEGKLYSGSHHVGRFHHSSFLAGGAVASAGEISTDASGRITVVSNKSGHYKPSTEQLLNMLRFLESKGVDLSSVQVELIDRKGVRYNAKEFLENPAGCNELPK